MIGKKQMDRPSIPNTEKETSSVKDVLDLADKQERVRQLMINFIKGHYAHLLGDDVALLDEPDGLEILHKKYCGPTKGE